jgi:hypothetical protein
MRCVKNWQAFNNTIYILKPLNHFFMGNLLYLIAVILVIAWAIGFLGYHASGLIHLLLVIAVIAILLRVIRGAS